jgi:multiple sugar transport system permease protein
VAQNTRQTFRFADERAFFLVSFIPTALIVIVLLIFPIVFTLGMSFFHKNTLVGPYVFAGLENFTALLDDPQFYLAFKNGILYSGGSTLISLVFGLAVALVLNEDFKGRTILRAIVIFPYIVPPIVALFIWKFLFNSRGIINVILSDLGIITEYIPWLGDSRYAMITVILISSWVWFPFSAINFLAGLQGIPQDIYEAAAIDGASALRRFTSITLPLLSPIITVMVVIRFIWAARNFDMIYLLTGGGPVDTTTVLPILAYKEAFGTFRLGYASTVATALFIFLTLMALIYFQVYSYTTNLTSSKEPAKTGSKP